MTRRLIILLLFSVSVAFASDDVKQAALTVFEDYLQMHEELKAIAGTGTGKNSHQYRQLAAQIDSIHQNVYLPALRKAKLQMMQTGDTTLLTAYFKVLLATSYRGDDYQRFAIGDIYLSQPDSVAKTYRQFDTAHRQVLYKILERGFMDVAYRNKDVLDYDVLKAKLLDLQPEKTD